MPSGGARGRSGPAPDPNALRRDRKDDRAWVTLPVSPVDDVPAFPLADVADSELELWAELWEKPQAHMWLALGLKYQVAFYVRNFLKASAVDAAAAWVAGVLRQEAEIGLSTVGMAQLRWKIAADEVAEKRGEAKPQARSARDRLKALNA